MIKPPLIPSIIVLAFVILMTNLGFWQLNRAEEKERLLLLLADDKVTFLSNKRQIKQLEQYANVEMKGHFLQAPQLLLDNQIDEKIRGYHVFTPFQMTGLDTTILVNRGWIAQQGFNAKQLSVETREVTISGKLNNPPQVGIQLGEIELNKQAPFQIMTYFEKEKISDFMHEKICTKLSCVVSDEILWLEENQQQGFKRNWKPIIMSPAKHFGYAVQWFSMTIVLILLFIYWLRKSA